MENRLLQILNNSYSPGRGKQRDQEEGGTRRKEGRGGRRDEEGGGRRKEQRGGKSDVESEKTKKS